MTATNVQVAFATPMRRLMVAIVSGGLAILFLYYYIDKTLLESSGGERIPVLVSTKVVRPGERIDGQGVAVQSVPTAYVHGNSVRRKDQDKVVGRRVFRQIAANQPLLWSDFDAPETERGSGVALTKGMRAVAMPIGESLRKAHLLKMGDTVDIIYHFTVPQGSVAVTLFQRIVIIDQMDEVAVLALSPEQAELLAFAQAHGTATLTLRNREDTEQKELTEVSFRNLLKDFVDVRTSGAVSAVGSSTGSKNESVLHLLEQMKQRRGK